MRGMDMKRVVADFTDRLHAAIDEISIARAREAVMHALGEKRGRMPKGLAAVFGRKPRRKGPRQLCPVPGCQNPAAPVFGMVCGEHKDVPKKKIKQYREARRAAKLRDTNRAPARRGPGRPKGSSVGRPAGGRRSLKAKPASRSSSKQSTAPAPAGGSAA